MDVALLLLAVVGHGAIWVAAINRAHAHGWPRLVVQVLTTALFGMLLLPPLAAAAWLLPRGGRFLGWFMDSEKWQPGPVACLAYLLFCSAAGVLAVVQWFRRHVLHRPPHVLRFHRTRSLPLDTVAVHTEEHPHHFLVHLPGNESLQLDLTERVIDVPRLPPALDGLSIVHLSDFHFTGRVAMPYFQEVVRLSNELGPDLVALTGDIVDRTPCIDWIPETLGHLDARHGVYYVLGNHDIRVDIRQLRDVLGRAGLVHVGGRWIEIEVRGQRVVLAGNELPWLRPAAALDGCPPRDGAPLRIALAHSPDQLAWARDGDFDVLLAGHTHGGQIRLPGIGPIFSPTRDGVACASGVFYAPPTTLHVTRGISAELPLRWNCPPEMAHLRLHAGG